MMEASKLPGQPPGPGLLSMGRSEYQLSGFEVNGFAALDVHQQPQDDDAKSDGGDSLFFGSCHGDGETISSTAKSAEASIKHEEQSELNNPSQVALPIQSTSTLSITIDKTKPESRPQLQPADSFEEDDDLMIVDEVDLPNHVKAKFLANQWRPLTPEVEIVGARIKEEPGLPEPVIKLQPDIPEPEVKQETHGDDGSLFGDDDFGESAELPDAVVDVAAAELDSGSIFVDDPVGNNEDSTANKDIGNVNHATGDAIDDGSLNAQGDDNANDEDQENGEVVDLVEDDGEFYVDDDQELSDGEQPRVRRRRPPRKSRQGGSAQASAAGVVELDKNDIEEELKILEAELELYHHRKEQGKIGPNDVRLQNVIRKISELKEKLDKVQPTAEHLAAEGLRRMLEAEAEAEDSEDDGQGGRRPSQRREATRIPAIARNRDGNLPVSTGQKRRSKGTASNSHSRAKKQKTGSAQTRASVSAMTQTLLEMVRSNDPIAARAQMDDVQVFTAFKADTLKRQMQILREQIEADPERDQRRINADLRLLTASRRTFGRKFCKPLNGQWMITGMKKLLHHYQLVGSAWMLGREVRRGDQGPFGGILADSVGLGKTIEAIACILGNQLSEEEKAAGKFGTLIVVPSTLVGQWQDELDACCPDLTVVHYHSAKANRVRPSNIRKADVVVTTYHEVAKGFPNRDVAKRLENLEETEKTAEFNEALGDLFTVEWHRIILDEAHAIKNSSTQTSKACINLRAKNRWALTATPLHNGVHEILPYMEFVGAVEPEPLGGYFSDKQARKLRPTGAQIQEFIHDRLMQRNWETLFLGKCLVKIPKPHPLPNVWIDLSEEEFLIYRRIEEIIRRKINEARAMPGMTRKKTMATFFTLAIRLRQAVSHPFTLFKMMQTTYDFRDIRDIRRKMAEIKRANPNRRFIEQVGSWCEKQLDGGQVEGKVLKSNVPDQFGNGDHGLEFNMDPQLAKLEKQKASGGGICKLCSEPYSLPRKTTCGHTFCKGCLEDFIETEKEDGNINCPVCNREFGVNEIIVQHRKRRVVNPNMPGNDWLGRQPLGDEESGGFLAECDTNDALSMAPSAKTATVKDIILKWQREAPDDKIIVFTQWVVVGRVLGRLMHEEKISFVYFFGEMSREEKEDSVKLFHDLDEVKVMIASLKCGGQGLNLSCANRVILLDPWWNSALEQQGYGRVFRMGQTKETWFVRLLTRKTIDGRMAKLQAKKLKEIKGAVKDFDSTRATLNFEEMAELFGRVRRDENGKMIEVESDYDTDDEEEGVNGIEGLGGIGNGVGQAEAPGSADANQGANKTPPAEGFGYGDSVVNGFGIQDLVQH